MRPVRWLLSVLALTLALWAVSQQKHGITGEWASLDGHERDAIDAGLRILVESGKNQKGSWIKARIYEAIKELNGSDAKSPTVEEVLCRLPETLRKSLLAEKE